MGFKDEMEQHDEAWEVDRESGGLLPDGDYPGAIITESRLDHDDSDNTYTWVVRWEAEYSIQSSDKLIKGGIRKFYNLDHEVGRSIAAQDSKRLGFDGKLSELEDANEREEFIGLLCDIVVKTKPGETRDFKNVYINRVLGKDPEAVTAAAASGVDDDIPF